MPRRFKSPRRTCARERRVGAERRFTNFRTTRCAASRRGRRAVVVRGCAASRPARSDSRSSSVEVRVRRVRSDPARRERQASEDRRSFLSVVSSLPPERTIPAAFVDRTCDPRHGSRPKRHGSRTREMVHAAALSGVVRCVVARVIRSRLRFNDVAADDRRSAENGLRRHVCTRSPLPRERRRTNFFFR